MFIAISFLMTTVASSFAQEVVKDSTSTIVSTSTQIDSVEVQVPIEATTKTVSTTTTVELGKTEMKSADLPQLVKDTNASYNEQGWETEDVVYSVKDETDQIVYYLVTFKNTKTGEFKNVNINAQGGII